MNINLAGPSALVDQIQHPLSSSPLLEQQGSSLPKSDKHTKGLCHSIRKKKRATIIIGLAIAVFFICLAVVAISVLLPLFASSTSRSKGATEESLQSFLNNSTANQTLVRNPMESFAGNWILHNQDEHLDSFLKAIGVGFLERLFAPSITSEMDVVIEGPTTVTLEFRILIKTIKATFQLDEEFEFKTVDGRTVMTSHGLEDGNFVTRERWDHGGKEKRAKYIRKIIDDQMVNHMYVDDIISIQRYVRIKK